MKLALQLFHTRPPNLFGIIVYRLSITYSNKTSIGIVFLTYSGEKPLMCSWVTLPTHRGVLAATRPRGSVKLNSVLLEAMT